LRLPSELAAERSGQADDNGRHAALLGKIKVPFTVSNLTFGGRNRARLFVCASHTLYAIYTNQRGAARP